MKRKQHFYPKSIFGGRRVAIDPRRTGSKHWGSKSIKRLKKKKIGKPYGKLNAVKKRTAAKRKRRDSK